MNKDLEEQLYQYMSAIDHYNTLSDEKQRLAFMDIALLGQTVILSLLVTIAEK